jgi:pimeloyl-ACP methyl ester carboxylesterase
MRAMVLACCCVSSVAFAETTILRSDASVASDAGISIFVRELRGTRSGGVPILLVHGARVPGIASFDLPITGGSLAAELAAAGHRVFIVDVRGYGASTRPREMSEAPVANAPLVRSDEAVRDIDAVVRWISTRTGVARVATFGWATGGHWAGMYAALHPDRVSHLVMLNALYGADTPHALLGHGTDMEERGHPGQFAAAAVGAYRLSTAASLLSGWDRSIPDGDKSKWREPAIADAYVKAALASDATSESRTPPSLRSPSGALEDSFYQATGRQLWDASLVRSATLIVRSERDFWSRAEDVSRLAEHLVHAARVRVVTLRGATHFVHLERAERGRRQLLDETLAFIP